MSDSLIAQALAQRQAGRIEEAAELFERALARDPGNGMLRLHAGETLFRLGRLHAARDAVTTALAGTAVPDGLVLLGRIQTALGETAAAIRSLERAIAARPDQAVAWRFLAPALFAAGRRADAEAAFAKADRLQRETADHYNQLGIELLGARRAVEAEAAFRHAIARQPTLAPAYQNLGAALAAQDRLPEGIAAETRATELDPKSPSALNNLAIFEGSGGDFAAARSAVSRALKVAARHADSLHTLAGIRLEEGDAAAAIDLLEQARAVHPQHLPSPSLLLARNYVRETDDAASLDEARAVGRALRPAGPAFAFNAHDRQAERRLRIGYVSGDFRRHSCASFIRPLFAAHDPDAVELFAYSENPADDEITDELRGRTRTWRTIASLGDAAAAELIYRDRIDILVDLAGHMAGNRLPVFALKPAPVQVTWLGYPDTTGLDTIDYRVTDERADPPGTGDTFYSERLWRLPHCFLPFSGDSHAPSPAHAPLDGRSVTFGSFNHLPKVTPAVVQTWAEILTAVPQSRLLMKAKRLGDAAVCDRYLKQFAAHGVAAERLEFIAWQASASDHLQLYGRIDIALDPFPYNGTTTTCEALWMGVPVLALRGHRHAGRVGASLLGALDFDELVAPSRAAYIENAVQLANDGARLQAFHASLRERMRGSALCDSVGFARRLEAAYREMWRRWCSAAG